MFKCIFSCTVANTSCRDLNETCQSGSTLVPCFVKQVDLALCWSLESLSLLP